MGYLVPPIQVSKLLSMQRDMFKCCYRPTQLNVRFIGLLFSMSHHLSLLRYKRIELMMDRSKTCHEKTDIHCECRIMTPDIAPDESAYSMYSAKRRNFIFIKTNFIPI